MRPAPANGQPGLGLYLRGEDGAFHPFCLQVLTFTGEEITHVATFLDTALFAAFGLPAAL